MDYKTNISVEEGNEVSFRIPDRVVGDPDFMDRLHDFLASYEDPIGFKTVGQLAKEKKTYWIPSYQRGYRWGNEQVSALIHDIDEFEPETMDNGKKSWYCLQPVVVKRIDRDRNTYYELIDGQQRLTTIYLLLKVLGIEPAFDLNYEARTGAWDFLKNIKSDDVRSKDNIDFFYMHQAYMKMQELLKNIEVDDFREKLEDYTKIIWYEPEEESPSIDIFKRLNIGKIALTDAELIKALFLKNMDADNVEYMTARHIIAQEWDQMENKLRDDSFWYFLGNDSDSDNRIGYIFDLTMHTSKDGVKEDKFRTSHATFNWFAEKLQNQDMTVLVDVWNEVRKRYDNLVEWYTNKELYHLVGYILTAGFGKVTEIYSKKEDCSSKSDFKKYLESIVSSKLKNIDLNELSYGSPTVLQVLLWHNIWTMMKGAVRFPFDAYRKERWDIEHVISQTDNMKLPTGDDLEIWKTTAKEKLVLLGNEGKDLIVKIDETGRKLDENLFVEVIDKFTEVGSDEENDYKNSISNLVLLSANINRGYGNSVFPAKRDFILAKEREGSFIPICTRNVFLKAYTQNPDQLFKLTAKDRNSYFKDIQNSLNFEGVDNE